MIDNEIVAFIFLLDCKKKKKKEKKKTKKHHKHHDIPYNKEKDSAELINESVNSNKTVSDVKIHMDNNINNNKQYNIYLNSNPTTFSYILTINNII